MTQTRIEHVAAGAVIRFVPRRQRRHVTIRVTGSIDEYGWVVGYRARLEGDAVVTRGACPKMYQPPDYVEVLG